MKSFLLISISVCLLCQPIFCSKTNIKRVAEDKLSADKDETLTPENDQKPISAEKPIADLRPIGEWKAIADQTPVSPLLEPSRPLADLLDPWAKDLYNKLQLTPSIEKPDKSFQISTTQAYEEILPNFNLNEYFGLDSFQPFYTPYPLIKSNGQLFPSLSGHGYYQILLSKAPQTVLLQQAAPLSLPLGSLTPAITNLPILNGQSIILNENRPLITGQQIIGSQLPLPLVNYIIKDSNEIGKITTSINSVKGSGIDKNTKVNIIEAKEIRSDKDEKIQDEKLNSEEKNVNVNDQKIIRNENDRNDSGVFLTSIKNKAKEFHGQYKVKSSGQSSNLFQKV